MAVFGRQLRLRSTEQPPPQRRAQLQDAGGGHPPRVETGTPKRGEISLDNILLLIPADIVSVYMTGKGITSPQAAAGAPPSFLQANWQLICFLVCLVACFLFRVQASKPVGAEGLLAGVNWRLAIWTTVAFFLWGHAVSDVGPLIPSFAGSYAAFCAGLFGVFAPKLVPQNPAPS